MQDRFKTDLINDLVGTSYLMIFDGDIEHVRSQQPCMGELRKYESTHPGDCTQPIDIRPGDLHWPFPEGTPCGVYIQMKGSYINNEYKVRLTEEFFSDESPWYSGVKSKEFNYDVNGHILGVYINNGDFDPTVLVNLVRNFRGSLGAQKVNEYIKLREFGLSIREALAFTTMNTNTLNYGISASPGYYTTQRFSFRRFLDGNPTDLTGGSWKDRVDYNRKSMGEIFSDPNIVGTWLDRLINKGFPRYAYKAEGVLDIKKDASRLKDAIWELYHEEAIPKDEKYIWKTSSGRTNA